VTAVLLHFILRCRQRARRHAARAPATFDAKVKPGAGQPQRPRGEAGAGRALACSAVRPGEFR